MLPITDAMRERWMDDRRELEAAQRESSEWNSVLNAGALVRADCGRAGEQLPMSRTYRVQVKSNGSWINWDNAFLSERHNAEALATYARETFGYDARVIECGDDWPNPTPGQTEELGY